VVLVVDQDWLDEQRRATADLPVRPGATARIQYQVTGGPEGDVLFHTHLEDGRIVVNALGPDADADFSMLVPAEEFEAVACGERDASVGYMQGRTKVTGNIGRMLSVLPVTSSEEWRNAMRGLAGSSG
jgi:hypothetical protein